MPNCIETSEHFEITLDQAYYTFLLFEEQDCLSSLQDYQIIPENYSIYNIYPNPFNPIVNITYGLPENRNVKLDIYNIQGKITNTLLNNFQKAGHHSISWDASEYPSGIYFIKMISGDYINTQKLMLIK